MPTYRYRCNSCQEQFEVFQGISEAPLTTCTKCGEERIRRVVSGGIGVIFRGSGFYVNDSKAASTSTTSDNPATKDTTTNNAKGTDKSSTETKTPPAAKEKASVPDK